MSQIAKQTIKQSQNIYNILTHQHKALNTLVQNEVIFPLSSTVEDEMDKLIDTLRYNKGVYERKSIAISSNQVGLDLRFFCMGDFEANSNNILRRIEIISNPKILDSSKETCEEDEGCLSIPELVAYVTRPISIIVEYQNILGKKIKREMEGTQARIFQHELDHLDGIHMLKRANKIEQNPLYLEYIQKQENQKSKE